MTHAREEVVAVARAVFGEHNLMVRYPREGHGLRETKHIAERDDDAPLLPPVDVAAIADPHDRDDELLIYDFVENAAVTLADPVLVVATQLLDARRPRIIGKRADSGDDSVAILRRYAFEFLITL